MKRRFLKLPGILFLIIGIFLLLNSLQNITGFVTFESPNIKSSSLLGIILVAIGILMLSHSRTSQLEQLVGVFNSRKNNNPEDSFMMTDPELFFGKEGQLNLKKFKEEIAQIKKGSDGEELIKIIDEAYRHRLKAVAESDNEERAGMAEAFLQVLEPNYHRPIHKHEQELEDYSLTREEREEIKNAFRQWDGKLTKQQRRILRGYNLVYSPMDPHSKISYEGTGYNISISNSPSHSAGDYITSNIADLIEKGRKHEAEQRKHKKGATN